MPLSRRFFFCKAFVVEGVRAKTWWKTWSRLNCPGFRVSTSSHRVSNHRVTQGASESQVFFDTLADVKHQTGELKKNRRAWIDIRRTVYLDPHSGSNFCLFKKICLNQGLSLKTACGQKSLFGQSSRCCKLLAKHLSCKSAVLKQCSTLQFGRESA